MGFGRPRWVAGKFGGLWRGFGVAVVPVGMSTPTIGLPVGRPPRVRDTRLQLPLREAGNLHPGLYSRPPTGRRAAGNGR